MTRVGGARADESAEGRTQVDTGLFGLLKRTVTKFLGHGLADWAAALTYYGLMSLFPALIAFVGIFGLVADPAGATRTITDVVNEIGPDSAVQTFAGPIRSITSSSSSGYLAIAGFVVAVWSASGYVGAFIRASNVIYEAPEGRPAWKLRPLQLAITLVSLVLAATAMLALIVSGPVAKAIGSALGVSDAAVTIYQIAKWPFLAAVLITLNSFLYYTAPNVKLRGFRWVTPGSVVAVVIWVIASAAFAFYVSNFGSYDKTYGTLGGVVVLLVWMWIANLAILFGHELNAERERNEELKEGVPGADRELQLEPREEPDDARTT
jgi:membrane protein